MQHISTVTVPSGGSSSITFMSVGDIPSEYTDLLLVVSGRTNRSLISDGIKITLNGSGSNFSGRSLDVFDGTLRSYAISQNEFGGASAANSTSSVFGNTSFYFPNYRSSIAKSFSIDLITENNATGNFMGIQAGLWNPSTNVPITSISIAPWAGTLWSQYSSASLYGITAGSDGIVAVS